MSTALEPAVRPRHPRGLYVLFASEMWERFSFYSMLGMFVLYLQNETQGFGWSKADAIDLYSWYLALVYFTPFLGGIAADQKLGYRVSVMIGAVFMMAGHLLLSVQDIWFVYAALGCLIIGNGFFKPNISAMVGNLYPEGSPLKDRAYNIFYMGINIGALAAPIAAELNVKHFGFHVAFAVAAAGMLVSLFIVFAFRRLIADAEQRKPAPAPAEAAAAVTPSNPIDAVPDSRRVMALLVVFATVIVFWMIFHQQGSTITFLADENIRWSDWGLELTGIISNAINPFFVILLTPPLVWFWGRLAARGKEPSTPTKMMIGMLLTGLACTVLFAAGKAGADTGQVSPAWLFGAYAVLTLGELMLSPMGLSLTSKVAPRRWRGVMMGFWFVATSIGNKLTWIGVYWESWRHSSFFILLGVCAFGMAAIMFVLLRMLKRAMPGV